MRDNLLRGSPSSLEIPGPLRNLKKSDLDFTDAAKASEVLPASLVFDDLAIWEDFKRKSLTKWRY